MVSTKINKLYMIHRIGMLFCAAAIPLAPFIASLGLIAFIVVNVILIYKRRGNISIPKIYLLLCVPFLISVLSFTTKYDTIGSLDLLIRTLPILILPLLFSANSDIIIKLQPDIIKFYLYGLTISCGISLAFGIYHFLINDYDFGYLTYYKVAGYLSLHPTYLSIFTLTGVVFVLNHRLIKNVYFFIMFILFIMMILLLQSRMAYILLFIVLCYYFYKYLRTYRVYFIPFLVILLLIIMAIPNSLSRLKDISFSYNTMDQELIGNDEENGVSQRVWLWSNAWHHIKEKPILGYGFRSQETVFKWKIEKENLQSNENYEYHKAAMAIADWNLHNQYLQVLYESGFFGLIIFILSISILLKSTYFKRNKQFIMIYLIFLSFLGTENLLDRQMGIYFYSFIFPSLLGGKLN